MSIIGLPLILFKVGEDDDDLTKIILQASFDGRLKSDEGFLTVTGDLCTLTAAAGKDLYLTAAKISGWATGTATNALSVELKVNGTNVETAGAATDEDGSSSVVYQFVNLSQKVAPTQILKLEVVNIQNFVDVEGVIQAIEVPTGENPATYTGP